MKKNAWTLYAQPMGAPQQPYAVPQQQQSSGGWWSDFLPSALFGALAFGAFQYWPTLAAEVTSDPKLQIVFNKLQSVGPIDRFKVLAGLNALQGQASKLKAIGAENEGLLQGLGLSDKNKLSAARLLGALGERADKSGKAPGTWDNMKGAVSGLFASDKDADAATDDKRGVLGSLADTGVAINQIRKIFEGTPELYPFLEALNDKERSIVLGDAAMYLDMFKPKQAKTPATTNATAQPPTAQAPKPPQPPAGQQQQATPAATNNTTTTATSAWWNGNNKFVTPVNANVGANNMLASNASTSKPTMDSNTNTGNRVAAGQDLVKTLVAGTSAQKEPYGSDKNNLNNISKA